MGLKAYQDKRHFEDTPEPNTQVNAKPHLDLTFVVQRHAASHLHFDFRLESAGVLKSWAVPKGPSMNSSEKRLAVEVEDHPLAYGSFEGTIPPGNYGAGEVTIWDKGSYILAPNLTKTESAKLFEKQYQDGHIRFFLFGQKLQGAFSLIRTQLKGRQPQWLLIKQKSDKDQLQPVKKKKEKKVPQQVPKKITASESTHLNRVYFPKHGYSKADLLNYYTQVCPYLLPYLKNRPQSLKRYPQGVEGAVFFQKDFKNAPKEINTALVHHPDRDVHYLLIQNQKSLLYAAHLGGIELHPFLSKYPRLDHPNYAVIDLDPSDVPFDTLIPIARFIHESLAKAKIPTYCKTSGKRGLHLYIPLGRQTTFAESLQFAEWIARFVNIQFPELTSLERSPSKRQGKIYIDFLQNAHFKSVVAPYSVRATEDATVSTPLFWTELNKSLDPKAFTIKTVIERLYTLGDPFSPLLKDKIAFKRCFERLKKLNSI